MIWLKRNRALSGVTALTLVSLVAFCLWSRGGNGEHDGKLTIVSARETAAPPDQAQKAETDFRQRYGLPGNAPGQTAGQVLEPLHKIRVTFRAVMLDRTAPGTSMSDADFAFEMEKELKKSPLFDSQETALTPVMTRDEATGTFSFGATLALKPPLKL